MNYRMRDGENFDTMNGCFAVVERPQKMGPDPNRNYVDGDGVADSLLQRRHRYRKRKNSKKVSATMEKDGFHEAITLEKPASKTRK